MIPGDAVFQRVVAALRVAPAGVGTLLLWIVLGVVSSHAQSVDLSKMTCKDFAELPKETAASLTTWLDGYLTGDEDVNVLDLSQIKAKADKLSFYCAQNPKLPIIAAAEDVLEK